MRYISPLLMCTGRQLLGLPSTSAHIEQGVSSTGSNMGSFHGQESKDGVGSVAQRAVSLEQNPNTVLETVVGSCRSDIKIKCNVGSNGWRWGRGLRIRSAKRGRQNITVRKAAVEHSKAALERRESCLWKMEHMQVALVKLGFTDDFDLSCLFGF